MKIYLYQEAESAKSRSFNYYLDQETVYIDEDFPDRKNGDGRILVYTGKKGYRALKNQSRQIETVAVFNHFRVSKLNLKFLDVKTRTDVLEKKYLLVLSP